MEAEEVQPCWRTRSPGSGFLPHFRFLTPPPCFLCLLEDVNLQLSAPAMPNVLLSVSQPPRGKKLSWFGLLVPVSVNAFEFLHQQVSPEGSWDTHRGDSESPSRSELKGAVQWLISVVSLSGKTHLRDVQLGVQPHLALAAPSYVISGAQSE